MYYYGFRIGICLLSVFLLSGLGRAQEIAPVITLDQPFAKINGEVITYRQYIHVLERQSVPIAGGQTTSVMRLALNQIVMNRVILERAGRIGAVPDDAEVDRFYALQKLLYENQYPGKNYEEATELLGTSVADLKFDMKVQLAQTNLFAKKLNLTEQDLRDAYERSRDNIALPPRVQLRLVLVAANSPGFKQAQALFAAKKPFEEVARQVNVPQLRGVAGLVPQATAVASLAPLYRAKAEKLPEGAIFGPVDFQPSAKQPMAKAWIKIERKMPALSIPYEDALPLIKRQVVTVKLSEPENVVLRNEVVNARLIAQFEPTEPSYNFVWQALVKAAKDSGAAGNAPPIQLPDTPAN